MTLAGILNKALSGKGITYSLQFGDLEGEPFYVISTYKKREEKIFRIALNNEVLQQYIIKNSDVLWLDDHAIGVWESNNLMYLDVVQFFDKDKISLEKIRSMLYVFDQEAAWDLETNQIIER